MSEQSISEMLSFFKALADKSRLKILGAVAVSERSVEELSSMLSLQGPTVSHHLIKLREAGLVTMRSEGTTHLYSMNSERLEELSKKLLSVDKLAEEDTFSDDAWEQKVIKDFFEGDRLKVIPASRKKREVILRFLAEQFQTKKEYPEKKVNKIIQRYHDDFATLRRELIGAKLLERSSDGIYWRPEKN